MMDIQAMDETRFAFLMIGGMFSLIGVIFGAVGLPFLLRIRRFRRRGVQTDAVVERLEFYRQSVFPVLSYYAEGQHIESRSLVGCSPCPYHVGDIVTIWYLPDKPRRYAIEGDRPSKILGGIFAGLGGFFLLIGIFFLFLFLRG